MAGSNRYINGRVIMANQNDKNSPFIMCANSKVLYSTGFVIAMKDEMINSTKDPFKISR